MQQNMLEQWERYTQEVAERVARKHAAITHLNEECTTRSLERWQCAKADQDAQNTHNEQRYQEALRVYTALPWYKKWYAAKPEKPIPLCGLALFHSHHFAFMYPDEVPTLEDFFTWLAAQQHLDEKKEEDAQHQHQHNSDNTSSGSAPVL